MNNVNTSPMDVTAYPACAFQDIRDISIDKTKSPQERRTAFLQAAEDPYVFRVDDLMVKLSFPPNGIRLEDALSGLIQAREGVPFHTMKQGGA